MNTIEKIRTEIERRMVELAKDKYIDLHDTLCRTKELNLLLSFLDTLEEEPVDLEEEIEKAGKDVLLQAHKHNKRFDIPQNIFDDVQLMDIFKAGVYKGFELGRNAK